MKKKGLLFVFVAAAMLVASCGGGAAAQPEVCEADPIGCAVIPEGETIKIGMGAPLTGDAATFGIDISQGAMVAAIDAGTLEGFSFELVAEDTQGTPEAGAAVANKFATDPTMVAIPGHIFSGSTEAAMPIYEDAGMPMMSPSATNPPLTELGSTVFNRLAFTDAIQGRVAAEYLFNTLGVTKIAVIHDGGTYGQGLADIVAEEFAALGGEVVGYEAITVGETDYTATLSVLAAADPEAIYFGGYVGEGVVLTNNMKQTGLEDAIFFGCDGTFGAEFIDKTAENGEGAYAASLVPPASDAKDAFDAAYLEEFGAEAGSLSPYTWSAYDAAAVLIAKVKEVAVLGDDGSLYIPRAALVEVVRSTSGYMGITGEVTCNEVGECNTAGPTFYIVSGGEWVQAN